MILVQWTKVIRFKSDHKCPRLMLKQLIFLEYHNANAPGQFLQLGNPQVDPTRRWGSY